MMQQMMTEKKKSGNETENAVENHLGSLVAKGKSLPDRCRNDIEQNIEDYKRLILKMAHKYVRNRVEIDDLVQEAMIGLILADRDFNPERSNDFHTYAIYRIKGKMYEYCIGNENPIYVPTHVAKAASYVKQMQRLLDRVQEDTYSETASEEIIRVETHAAEKDLSATALKDLRELKRKLGRIAFNSKMSYEKLAGLALKSLSLVVSDDILSKLPRETEMTDEYVSCRELWEQLRESLGEKRFLVFSMREEGWTYEEIAEKLFELGYTNRDGQQVSRQAVKGIYDETQQAVRRSRLFKRNGEE